jgi:hypothetical protein
MLLAVRCPVYEDVPEAEILLATQKPPDRIVTYLGNLERSDLLLCKYCIPTGYLW